MMVVQNIFDITVMFSDIFVTIVFRMDVKFLFGYSDFVTDMSDKGNPNQSRTVVSALGGVFVGLAILVLSGVLLAWFIWSAKHKKKYFEASRTQNIYHMDGSE